MNNSFAHGLIGWTISPERLYPGKPEMNDAEKDQLRKYELLMGESAESLDRMILEDAEASQSDLKAVGDFNQSQTRVNLEMTDAAMDVIYVPDFLSRFRAAMEEAGIAEGAALKVVVDYATADYSDVSNDGTTLRINARNLKLLDANVLTDALQRGMNAPVQSTTPAKRSEVRTFEDRVKDTGRLTIVLTGLSRSGKSSAGRILALRIGGIHFSSGEIFRAATYIALAENIPLDTPEGAAKLAEAMRSRLTSKVGTAEVEFYYNGKLLKAELDEPAVVKSLGVVGKLIGKGLADEIFFSVIRDIEKSGKHLILDFKRGISPAILEHTDIEVNFAAEAEVRARRALAASLRSHSLAELYRNLQAPGDEDWNALVNRVGTAGAKEAVYQMFLRLNNERDARGAADFQKTVVTAPRRIAIDTSKLTHVQVQTSLQEQLVDLMGQLGSASQDADFKREIQKIRTQDFAMGAGLSVQRAQQMIREQGREIVTQVLDLYEAPTNVSLTMPAAPDALLIPKEEFADRAAAILGFDATTPSRKGLRTALESIWTSYLDERIAEGRKTAEQLDRESERESDSFVESKNQDVSERDKIVEKFQRAARIYERLIVASGFNPDLASAHQEVLRRMEEFYARSNLSDDRPYFLMLVPTTSRP
ncbi:MAG: (d)CMP kinase, partial [Deltaproteobacteria bacterium]